LEILLTLLRNIFHKMQIDLSMMRDGSEAVVSVRDNGIGIPADKLPTIFELFAQVDPLLERASGGLGIGLNLSRRIIEKHGGKLSIRSEALGRGSQFHVRLPLLVSALDHASLISSPA
jgi:signal transduction histidine kinase